MCKKEKRNLKQNSSTTLQALLTQAHHYTNYSTARDSNFNHYALFLSWIRCQGLIQIQRYSITEIYFTITITGVHFWEAFINYDTGCQIHMQTWKSDSPFRWYMPYSFLSTNYNLEQTANENRRWWILITLKPLPSHIAFNTLINLLARR